MDAEEERINETATLVHDLMEFTEPGTIEILKIMLEDARTYDRKSKDYGKASDVIGELGMVALILIKAERLRNLRWVPAQTGENKLPMFESVEDTYRDLSVYAAMARRFKNADSEKEQKGL